MGQDGKVSPFVFSTTVKRSFAKYDLTIYKKLDLAITVIVHFLGKLQNWKYIFIPELHFSIY